jgi:hypothetical protein
VGCKSRKKYHLLGLWRFFKISSTSFK